MPLAAETLEQFDKKLETELRAMDPVAVAIWLNANTARAANHHQEAVRLYAEVYKRVPKFVHALRRQAGEEMELGQKIQAHDHARQALAQDRSTENLATMALMLIRGTRGVRVQPDRYRTGIHRPQFRLQLLVKLLERLRGQRHRDQQGDGKRKLAHSRLLFCVSWNPLSVVSQSRENGGAAAHAIGASTAARCR